jgi:hypothetical protein
MNQVRWMGGLLALVLLGSSCDSGKTAGGSFETENVTAFVVSVDSIAPPARRVGWVSYVATVRLDSNVFDFDRASLDGSDLVVEEMDGTPIPFAIRHWQAKEQWARVQVRLEGDLLRKGARFRMRSAIVLAPRSDSTAVWNQIPESVQEQWTSVLVDDFESGTNHTRLPDDSTWYTKKTDTATISNPVYVEAGDGRSGTALRFDFNAPIRVSYCLLGTTLATHPVNFASLDSIVFWAKGNGILSVSLDHIQEGGGSKTWMHDSLKSTWTRWRVRPRDFDSATTGGNLGWASVHDSVTALSFFAAGAGTVMLDEIRFFGMHEDDFR